MTLLIILSVLPHFLFPVVVVEFTFVVLFEGCRVLFPLNLIPPLFIFVVTVPASPVLALFDSVVDETLVVRLILLVRGKICDSAPW